MESISAAAMYEFTMGLAGVSQWLLITVMIPLIRLELLMKMTGNMVKEETLSRLNDLLDQVIRWGESPVRCAAFMWCRDFFFPMRIP